MADGIKIHKVTLSNVASNVSFSPVLNTWSNDGPESHLWRYHPKESRPPIVRPAGVAYSWSGSTHGWRETGRVRWMRRAEGGGKSELVGVSGLGVRHRRQEG